MKIRDITSKQEFGKLLETLLPFPALAVSFKDTYPEQVRELMLDYLADENAEERIDTLDIYSPFLSFYTQEEKDRFERFLAKKGKTFSRNKLRQTDD